MSDPYLLPGSQVLRNKLGLTSAADLNLAERRLVALRIRQGAPVGRFDLRHLQAIHKHLFQDVYDWASEVRTTSLNKGGQDFQGVPHIGAGMADVHRRVVGARYFQGLDHARAAQGLGRTIGDVNFVHPFREGNGRTQLQYAKQLAERAGYILDIAKLGGPEWVNASRQATDARYDAMIRCFEEALVERPVRGL